MRKGWEYKKLGEVCEVVTGTTPKTNIPEYWGKGHYWVTPAELNDTTVYIDKTERQITDEALSKTKLRLLPVGTVLLSSRAPIGKVAIANAEMYCNQGFKNCICSEAIYNKYLFYFLRLKKDYLNSLGRGATFKEISKSIVESIKIPLPPQSTQLAIVSELDKINELIRLKKEQLKDFDNLAQSLFYEMFGDPVENEKGWEVKKLGEIYTFIDYRGKTPTKIKSGIPLITAKNVKRGFLDYTIAEYISPQDFLQRQSRGIAQKGDLLFTTEAPLGNVAIANISVFSTGQRLIALQQKCELENRYVMFHMLTDYFQDVLKKHATGSTAQGIQAAKLKHIPIPLPPLSLQRLFAQRIEQIEREKSEVQKSIQDLETLLASRMQYWFE
ncbi:restriction endonuclease subunit S [Prevotella copri]|uniref:Restriction endonuclease subunit S n=1 Tax=Segatella copri TaxID=165179 RepID=A0AA91A5C5_9BACT|nr:restriction endonuclease subunit S [Segatella copri]MQO09606.1 restriction endonuclease subunit S [Segatella copri]